MFKKIVIAVLLLSIVSTGLALTYAAWLPLPGTLLLPKDNIREADCIVPLAGDTYVRFAKAAELYKRGYSKSIVLSIEPDREKRFDDRHFMVRLFLSKDISEKEFTAAALKFFGIEPDDIHFTRQEITSTYEEAVATKEQMISQGLESLILVTSPYHTRRALMIFKRVFKRSGIVIYHSTANDALYDPHHWWKRERDVKKIFEEYVSIVYNFLYHFILGKGRRAFDTF